MSSDQMQAKGFLAALFDFSFTSFITLKFLRVIYAVLVGLILLGGVFFLLAGLASRSAAGVLLALVGVPLVTLLYLVLARVYLELVALLFRIGENTSAIARALTAQGGPTGWGAPAGPAPYSEPPAADDPSPYSPWGPPEPGQQTPPQP